MNDTEIRDTLTRILTEHRLALDVPADPERAREAAGAVLSWLHGIARRVAPLVVPDAERVIELHRPDGEPTGVYLCTTCRAAYADPQWATCCGPRFCECGAELSKHFTDCGACFDRKQAASAKAQWEKATPMLAATYGYQMVYVEDERGHAWPSSHDGWHQSVEALCERVDTWRFDHPGEPDPVLYVFGSKPRKMTLDAASIIESALEEHHEDAHYEIGDDAKDEMARYLDAWAEEHGPTTYDPDLGIKIVGWEAPERCTVDHHLGPIVDGECKDCLNGERYLVDGIVPPSTLSEGMDP